MGASCWAYFVPYQQDIAAALEQCRQETFRQGNYELDVQGATSIDEALEMSEEAGTHSILDIMNGVADTVESFAVSPLTDAELIKFYNTVQPTRQMIEASLDGYTVILNGQDEFICLYDLRRNWEGCYIVVYDDVQPVEICFAGCTGD